MPNSSAEEFDELRDEIHWLVRMRWIAAAGLLGGAVSVWLLSEAPWLARRLLVLAIVVAGYNVIFGWLTRRRRPHALARIAPVWIATPQVLFDLVALALLSSWTGGIRSPLTWLFLLHMVIASLLLRPALAYGAFVAAMLLEFGVLQLTGRWPQSTADVYRACTLIALMFITVAVVNHITGALRRQRAEVRKESERRNAILETAADGIITIDATGRIQSVNPATQRIFRYSQDEMIGRNIAMLMPEPDHSQHDEYLARYRRTREPRIIGIGREVQGRRKDGEIFSLDLAVSEVRIDGEVFYTGILRDITERKQAEAELERLYNELKRHQEVLVQQEKMAAIGSMAAGIAHEISNPLASLNSLIQILRRQPHRLDEKMLGQFDDLVNRILLIVRQLTEFAHPLHLGWEEVSVNELVRDAIELLRFDRRLRRVDVHMDLSSNEITARWMPQAVHQVLVNLISNAMDAMDDVEDPHLEIRTRVDDGMCIIEVADTGHGIAAEDVNKVFDPFYTTKPVGRGTGLGLSISYNLVRSHGGRIDVESRPGQGTRFSVVLPQSCEREGQGRAFPETGNRSA